MRSGASVSRSKRFYFTPTLAIGRALKSLERRYRKPYASLGLASTRQI